MEGKKDCNIISAKTYVGRTIRPPGPFLIWPVCGSINLTRRALIGEWTHTNEAER